MKIRPVAAELLHADGHTDGRADMMVFRDFANAPKNAWNKGIISIYCLNKYTNCGLKIYYNDCNAVQPITA